MQSNIRGETSRSLPPLDRRRKSRVQLCEKAERAIKEGRRPKNKTKVPKTADSKKGQEGRSGPLTPRNWPCRKERNKSRRQVNRATPESAQKKRPKKAPKQRKKGYYSKDPNSKDSLQSTTTDCEDGNTFAAG